MIPGCIPTGATPPTPPAVTLVANAEGDVPTIAPNTWVEVKGTALAPAGDRSQDHRASVVAS